MEQIGPERPASVRLGGLIYKIEYETSNLDPRYASRIDFENINIHVFSTIHVDRQKECMLHEVLHGIDHIIGCDDRVKEEENIARSEVLFAFLREPRNRAAVEWIMSEAE
jgi:hypothetical protein